MAQFIKKYKHGLIILVYAIVYLMFFGYLEHRPVRGFHAIDTVFDDYIPFCEFYTSSSRTRIRKNIISWFST